MLFWFALIFNAMAFVSALAVRRLHLVLLHAIIIALIFVV